jgi:asparagine synthase (glutamine-hydrolysing)
MCGICGVVQIGGEPREVVSPEMLIRMTDAMIHRGPNDEGAYQHPGVALGVRRLSIVDVEGGHQPVTSEDKQVWAIQNGELYNHDVLRSALRVEGHAFLTRCDTEVLPHLYERFGLGFETRLRGKFALAVWDAKERRAVLVRDRLGVKPLYYAIVGDLVVFASELKSLLASNLIAPSVDFEAVDAYLTLGYFPTPSTPLAGVKKLRPGHRLVIDGRGVREEQYWAYPKPNPAPTRTRRPVEEYAEGLLERLEDSVRARLMSDVPLGAMLSGGIDSSIVVALMARNMTEPLKTFSVAFAESGADNELEKARMVARTFGTDHHELELSLAEETLELDDLVWHLDEPVSDLSSLGFLALSELASRYVTVALSGQGADELFAGYRKHVAAALAGAWRRLPPSAQKFGLRVAHRGPARLKRPASTLAATDPSTRLLAMSGQFDHGLRADLARGPLAELDGGAALRAVRATINGLEDDPLAATLYLDGQLALVDDMLHYFDRMSMAHSLEVRVPFLDHELVEYAATIPSRHKVHRLRTRKYVLKKAAQGLIPDEIIERRKIAFFENSARALFRAQLRGAVADYLMDPRPRYAEFLDRDGVRRLVRQHVEGSHGRNGKFLLAILLLEIWLRSFLDRALLTPRPPAGVPLVIAR